MGVHTVTALVTRFLAFSALSFLRIVDVEFKLWEREDGRSRATGTASAR